MLRFSSAQDTLTGNQVAIKKLSRPFQSVMHAKRAYRELRLLKHMCHENVSKDLSVYPDTLYLLLKFKIIKSEHRKCFLKNICQAFRSLSISSLIWFLAFILEDDQLDIL